jgi:hypothetical protein
MTKPAVKKSRAGTPPRPLGKHGMALWQSVMAEYEISDSGGVEILVSACSALDRAESLSEAIERDGAIVTVSGALKDHPGLKHELANRAFVVRALQRLGLDVEPVRPIGRPGGR